MQPNGPSLAASLPCWPPSSSVGRGRYCCRPPPGDAHLKRPSMRAPGSSNPPFQQSERNTKLATGPAVSVEMYTCWVRMRNWAGSLACSRKQHTRVQQCQVSSLSAPIQHTATLHLPAVTLLSGGADGSHTRPPFTRRVHTAARTSAACLEDDFCVNQGGQASPEHHPSRRVLGPHKSTCSSADDCSHVRQFVLAHHAQPPGPLRQHFNEKQTTNKLYEQRASSSLTLHFEVDAHGDVFKPGVDGVRTVHHQRVLVLLQTKTKLQGAFRRGDKIAFKRKEREGRRFD